MTSLFGNPLHGLWIMSTLGAGLFFCAGYLLSRGRRTTVARLDPVPSMPTIPPEPARDHRAEASLRHSLIQTEDRCRRLTEELNVMRGSLNQAHASLNRAQGSTAELAELKKKNGELQAQIKYARSIEKELRAQLRVAHRSSSASTRPRPRSSAPPVKTPLPPPVTQSARGVEYALKRVLENLRRDVRLREVVVADRIGFPVASLGSEADAMAACCAFLRDMARRACEIVPVGMPSRVTVEDVNGSTLTLCTFEPAEPSLLVLGGDERLSRAHLEQALQNSIDLLERDIEQNRPTATH